VYNALSCRTVAAIANDPDFHLNLKLQPGDIEIIHNPSTFHSRTKVVDAEVRAMHLLAVTCGEMPP
jgi:alpha-ketoglutarate-dependent taurine dioxygenase